MEDSLTIPMTATVKALGEVMPWRVDLHHYDLEAGQRKGGRERAMNGAGGDENSHLGGGFKYIFFSSRNLGKMNPFWRAYFSNGLVKNHQLAIISQLSFSQLFFSTMLGGNRYNGILQLQNMKIRGMGWITWIFRNCV